MSSILPARRAWRRRSGAGSSPAGLQLLRALAGLDIVAIDVNTVSPPHDVNGLTAGLAAQVVYEALVLVCRRLQLDQPEA